MDVMTKTCIIINGVSGDLCSLSLGGAAITTAQMQMLPGEQGQEEAQVRSSEKQVRNFHQYVCTTNKQKVEVLQLKRYIIIKNKMCTVQ